MKKTASERGVNNLIRGMTLADWAPAIFDLASRSPEITRAFKQAAAEEGITIDVLLHGMVADGYHRQGVPLPPDLRDYLMTQPMPTAVRDRLLKPHLS